VTTVHYGDTSIRYSLLNDTASVSWYWYRRVLIQYQHWYYKHVPNNSSFVLTVTLQRMKQCPSGLTSMTSDHPHTQ